MTKTVSGNTFQIVLANYGFVINLAVRLAPFPGLVNDIVQDVFTEFAQEFDGHDGSDVLPVLHRLTRRVAKRHYREMLRHSPAELREIAEYMAAKGEADTRPCRFEAELAAMKNCLDRLPEKSREIVDLHYFNNVTLNEIAHRKNIKPGTLRQILARIRHKLKECVNRTLQNAPFR